MKSKSSLLSGAIVFALAMLLIPVSLHAQEARGKITGRVTDPNKAAVPGATVKVADLARNKVVTLTTNGDGLSGSENTRLQSVIFEVRSTD